MDTPLHSQGREGEYEHTPLSRFSGKGGDPPPSPFHILVGHAAITTDGQPSGYIQPVVVKNSSYSSNIQNQVTAFQAMTPSKFLTAKSTDMPDQAGPRCECLHFTVLSKVVCI